MSDEAIRAIRWNRNGDHPDDGVGELVPDPQVRGGSYIRLEGKVVRFFRHPYVDGQSVCERCGRIWHDHGWIDDGGEGQTVCPGSIILVTKL